MIVGDQMLSNDSIAGMDEDADCIANHQLAGMNLKRLQANVKSWCVDRTVYSDVGVPSSKVGAAAVLRLLVRLGYQPGDAERAAHGAATANQGAEVHVDTSP
jgi:hypothetical protein